MAGFFIVGFKVILINFNCTYAIQLCCKYNLIIFLWFHILHFAFIPQCLSLQFSLTVELSITFDFYVCKTDDDETVEVDEIIGWEISLSKSGSESRQYVIEAQVLNAAVDEHPVPCDCMMARCSFIKAFNNQVRFSNMFVRFNERKENRKPHRIFSWIINSLTNKL